MLKSLRHLRIIWSVICAIACVLLIVLWVRSHYYLDEWSTPISQTKWFGASSISGQLSFFIGDLNPAVLIQAQDWGLESTNSSEWYARDAVQEPDWDIIFDAFNRWTICGPHWGLCLLIASLAVAPWLKWSNRFSLRTLLIGMTVVAAALGLIIAVSRWSCRPSFERH
jgi:hypothetical protein